MMMIIEVGVPGQSAAIEEARKRLAMKKMMMVLVMMTPSYKV